MKLPRSFQTTLCMLSIFSTTSLAYADTYKANEIGELDLTIGFGLNHQNSVYKGGKAASSFIPVIEAFWEPLFFSDGKLGSFIAGNKQWAANIAVGIDNIEDKDRGKSPLLRDMNKLKQVYSASVGLNVWPKWGTISVDLSTDVSHRHDGQMLALDYSYAWQSHSHTITPYFETQWISSEISQYYYGVSESEQTSSRPSYNAKDAFISSLGLNYAYNLDAHHSVMFDAAWKHLSKEINNSPIIKRSNTSSLTLVYAYGF